MPCIWEIKDKNKLVFAVDAEYKELLASICKDQINIHKGLPLQWEDIYYSFLAEVPLLVKKYNPKLGVPFRIFIAMQCKYFAKTMCRKYFSKNHAIMNLYQELDDTKHGVCDNTAFEVEDRFDLSILSKKELQYFKYHYLLGLSIEESCRKIGISRYKAEKLNKSIMRKAKRKYKI